MLLFLFIYAYNSNNETQSRVVAKWWVELRVTLVLSVCVCRVRIVLYTLWYRAHILIAVHTLRTHVVAPRSARLFKWLTNRSAYTCRCGGIFVQTPGMEERVRGAGRTTPGDG